MNPIAKKAVTYSLTCLFAVLFAYSLSYGGAGTSGAQFLKIGVDAKSAALGETGAVSSGSRSVFLNPAGLAGLEKTEIGASQVMWIEQISYSNLHFAKNAFGGTVGAGLNYLTVPAITKVNNTGSELSDTYAPNDTSFGVYYARALDKVMSWGAGIKYIQSRLDDVSATAIAADAGFMMEFPDIRTQAGIVVKNVGTQMKFVTESDPLPLTVKIGGKHNIPLGPLSGEQQSLNVLLDGNYFNDSGVSFNTGVEYNRIINETLSGAVRAGYKTSSTKGLSGAGASVGFGLGFQGWVIDYAFAPYGDLGQTNRISLSYQF